MHDDLETKGLLHDAHHSKESVAESKHSHLNKLENMSLISKTDLHPKTQMFSTIVNIIKSYIGLGILAAPYGFK